VVARPCDETVTRGAIAYPVHCEQWYESLVMQSRSMPWRGGGLLLGAALIAGCGFGLYSDDGSPSPGSWWPWACPDGGDASADGGCLPRCPDGAVDAQGDAGCVR
jgi:hypothetical protein